MGRTCLGVTGLGSAMAMTLLRDDLFWACSGSDDAQGVFLATIPSTRVSVAAATACFAPFRLDPAAAPGRHHPWRMQMQCLARVATFLLGESSAVCTRQPPPASALAGLYLPAWSSVHP